MKRMWSRNELKNISQNEAKAVKKDITTLVDEQGHNRFIEGDLETKEKEGVVYTYAKWSLSGTHLMIVCGGTIVNSTALSSFTMAEVPLPQWVIDKLQPLYGTAVDRYSATVFNTAGSTTQSMTNLLVKSNNKVTIQTSISATDDRVFRTHFDLLIDNE